MAGPVEGRLAHERDLYASLVELPTTDVTRWLEGVMGRLVSLVGAERGYVELYREKGGAEQHFSASFRCTTAQEDEIRAVTSRGIVAEAIGSGQTIHTPFALLDERFSDQPSVQQQRLEAILCVPFSGSATGVLYLEGRRGSGPFNPEDVAVVERVARYLAPLLDARAPYASSGEDDPTRPFRAKLKLDGIAGRSGALARVLEQIGQVAPLDITALLIGEAGTGKTQLARAIHDNSPRKAGPFVEVSCTSIPDSLFESELFGTHEGAFTGARRSMGKIEAAEGGTLFLDEVGDLSLVSQGKLLQLLQSKQYYALGSTKLLKANIRLVAATNKDLDEMVAEKQFREDLFYRLNLFVIRVPSLAERREDIQPLLDELIARVAFEHDLAKLPLSLGFRTACEAMEWRGNIRQLRSVVLQALIRARTENAQQLESRHLDGSKKAQDPGPMTFAEATRQFQRELLKRELDAAGWNTNEVASRLDLARSHVYHLIKGFNLSRGDGQK